MSPLENKILLITPKENLNHKLNIKITLDKLQIDKNNSLLTLQEEMMKSQSLIKLLKL